MSRRLTLALLFVTIAFPALPGAAAADRRNHETSDPSTLHEVKNAADSLHAQLVDKAQEVQRALSSTLEDAKAGLKAAHRKALARARRELAQAERALKRAEDELDAAVAHGSDKARAAARRARAEARVALERATAALEGSARKVTATTTAAAKELREATE